MATWPPLLDDLKRDMRMADDVTRFDVPLQQTLDAAVSYVERVRSDVDFTAFSAEDPTERDTTKVAVTDDLVLGTLRYARRLDIRRDSPSGMVVTDQIGATPVAGWDADIEKLLRIGRFARLRFA